MITLLWKVAAVQQTCSRVLASCGQLWQAYTRGSGGGAGRRGEIKENGTGEGRGEEGSWSLTSLAGLGAGGAGRGLAWLQRCAGATSHQLADRDNCSPATVQEPGRLLVNTREAGAHSPTFEVMLETSETGAGGDNGQPVGLVV